MKYKFTVFTPCYNGEKTIHRVFESMKSQNYDNWEWIIVNDGSTDDSDSVIKELIELVESKSRIKYITQANQGKHMAWNKAVSMASGDFFIPADCDDSFIPETLDFFNKKANIVCPDISFVNSNYSGISVCCYNPENREIIGEPYPEDGIVSDDIELYYKYGIRGEKWGCIRTDLLKKNPFPIIKGHYYNENFLWYSFPLQGYKKVNYNKKIRAYYFQPASLSNNSTYKFDVDKAKMQLQYQWWLLMNASGRLLSYSFCSYLREIRILGRLVAKYCICKAMNVR